MALGLFPVASLLATGVLVGLILGLIGGGGSILAVPLLVYLVGVPSAHVAIGTAAIAVALNAASGLASHARLGTVKWRCALVFSMAGMVGALLGASLGKQLGGTELLTLFGVAMIGVGIYMLAFQPEAGGRDVRLTPQTAAELLPRLLGFGLGVGLLSGFFGIGGGFLIVPGLMLATGMALQNAIATSLLAVTVLGLTTAASYANSGLIDWRLAALAIAGGFAGSLLGTRLNLVLTAQKRALGALFAIVVIAAGIYVAARGAAAFLGSS